MVMIMSLISTRLRTLEALKNILKINVTKECTQVKINNSITTSQQALLDLVSMKSTTMAKTQ